jgi:AraC-like DNA-binding protein
VQCGVITQAAAYSHYRHIVDTTEHTAWADIPTRVREREAPTGGDPLAVRIREYLDSHSLEKITLDSLAGAVGCSVRTATAAFRRAYGISVHIYLIRRRLAEAARLLVTTHMKVSAVAESVGFQDQTALYRHFRQVLGSTPTQVRKKPQSAELMATQLWIRRDQKRGA